jgi:hypothetical protein
MAMADEFDPEEFKRRLKSLLKESGEAFDGKYRNELSALAGLSRAEIDTIAPGITDLQVYDSLIVVVKEASRVNLAQAELAVQIARLGDIAIAIAKKIPTLAALL